MPLIIAKVAKRLIIPRKMRGIFPNEKELIIDLPAGVPVEVPDYVLNYYTKNRPHIFRLASEPEPIIEPEVDTEPTRFNPIEFIEQNYSNIKEPLEGLKRRELNLVATQMKLTGFYNQKAERVIERIVFDINAKQKQQEELEKHKVVLD